MNNSLFDSDPRFQKKISISEDKVHIGLFLKSLSRQIEIELKADPQFYRDYIFIKFDNVECRNILDSLSCLYGTYWEKEKKKYILRQFVHGVKNHLPKDANQLERMRLTDHLQSQYEKLPDAMKASLYYSEENDRNATMKFNALPFGMKSDILQILSIKEQMNSNPKEELLELYRNPGNAVVGMRVIKQERNFADRVELSVGNLNASAAMTVPNVVKRVREQVSGLDPNNPNCQSYKSGDLTRVEKEKIKRQDEKYRELISVNASQITHPRLLKLFSLQAKETNFLTFTGDNFEKKNVRIVREPLCDALDGLCRTFPTLTWDIRKSGVVVVRIDYVDMPKR